MIIDRIIMFLSVLTAGVIYSSLIYNGRGQYMEKSCYLLSENLFSPLVFAK